MVKYLITNVNGNVVNLYDSYDSAKTHAANLAKTYPFSKYYILKATPLVCVEASGPIFTYLKGEPCQNTIASA